MLFSLSLSESIAFLLFTSFFLLNNYLCRSSIKWSFLYLRMSSIQRLYTSMRVFFKFLDAWASQEPTMSVTLSHCHTVTFSLKSLPLQPLTYVWHPFTTPSLLLTHLDIMTLPKGQKCQKCQNIKISKISKISKNVKKNAKN